MSSAVTQFILEQNNNKKKTLWNTQRASEELFSWLPYLCFLPSCPHSRPLLVLFLSPSSPCCLSPSPVSFFSPVVFFYLAIPLLVSSCSVCLRILFPPDLPFSRVLFNFSHFHSFHSFSLSLSSIFSSLFTIPTYILFPSSSSHPSIYLHFLIH